jgi:hypothetical protein
MQRSRKADPHSAKPNLQLRYDAQCKDEDNHETNKENDSAGSEGELTE